MVEASRYMEQGGLALAFRCKELAEQVLVFQDMELDGVSRYKEQV